MNEDTPLTNKVARKWIKEQPMVPSDQQAVTLLIKTLFNHARDMERKFNAATALVVELEGKLSRMTAWLDANQQDVFRRGIWDAIQGEGKGGT